MEYTEFQRIILALLKLVVISMVLERALAWVFEFDWIDKLLRKKVIDPNDAKKKKKVSRIPGLRGIVALLPAVSICRSANFDIMAQIFNQAAPDGLGIAITSLVVAGGSSGAIAIFQGFLGMSKEARDALIAQKTAEAEAAIMVANMKTKEAEANRNAAVARVITEKRDYYHRFREEFPE